MPRRIDLVAAAALAICASACGRDPARADGARAERPRPQRAEVAAQAKDEGDRARRAAKESAMAPSVESLLAAPPGVRWASPGGLRWRVVLAAPITSIRWSTLGGLVVSTGDQIQNVTSRGVVRWSRVAGAGHRLYRIGGLEVLWSPAFRRLAALRPQGGEGWTRAWSAEVVGEELGEPLLVDAATVAAVGEDGSDRWRVALDGLRRLSGPYRCDGGILFEGSRGLQGVAVAISETGAVQRETALERGARVVGASRGCDPLVWNGAEIGLLDARGLHRWRREYASVPAVAREGEGFVFAGGEKERPVHVESIAGDGLVIWAADLPVTGSFSRFDVVGGALDGALVAGLCLDVESACARLDGDRGPYNAIARLGEGGPLGVLERQIQGHIGMARLEPAGLAIASSSREDATEVSLRDRKGSIRAVVTLPGRLSAGPFVGPSGEVYAATCDGWSCRAPHSLFAITGQENP
ncbi:MAG: hypothetical protein M0R80_05655 [Proteobacteria bacterium]|jgi:hypothetical protein|nr:hypothetical protein [Pseudomonadota bacterium]